MIEYFEIFVKGKSKHYNCLVSLEDEIGYSYGVILHKIGILDVHKGKFIPIFYSQYDAINWYSQFCKNVVEKTREYNKELPEHLKFKIRLSRNIYIIKKIKIDINAYLLEDEGFDIVAGI